MPERPDVGGFALAHADDDLSGRGDSFDVTNRSSFAYNGGAITIGGVTFGGITIVAGETLPPEPFLGMVAWLEGQFYYWDGAEWVNFSLDDAGPFIGAMGYDAATGATFYWDGTTWQPFSLSGDGLFVGVMAYDSAMEKFYYWNGTAWVELVISVAPADGTIRINAGVLEYYDACCDAWSNLEADLPTSDPGGGALWLEADACD